jgi:DNA (cytosine-5)-methyltransferase 1
MKFISLFSGIGGFDLGFERAGMECAAQVEIDKNCLQLLGGKFPSAERHNDVKDFHYGRTVDLVCGGFPCQDLSIAGKRAGLAGKRSGLWFEFHRILAELTPRWVVIENVPGLLSSNDGRDFAVILRGLGELGYLSAWRILDAQYFGLAQRRRRVFVVASLGTGSSAEILFERDGLSGNNPPGREIGKDIAYSLRSNPSHSGDKGDGGVNTTLIPRVAGTLAGGSSKAHSDITSGQQDGNVIAFQQNTRDEVRLMNGDGQIAGALAAEAGMKQQNYVANTNFLPQRVRIHDAAGVSPTLQSEDGRGQGVPTTYTGFGVRRLTPTECERLQGFPDGWTAGFADTVRYRMLGNAVAVPCAEWIARRIFAATQPGDA